MPLDLRQDLTTADVAKRWHCTTATVVRRIKAREFSGVVKIGERHYLIPIEEVEAFEKRRTQPGPRLKRR